MTKKSKLHINLALLLILSLLLSGCNIHKTHTTRLDAERSELQICEDNPMCFTMDDKKITVTDELNLANAITDTEWIDDTSIAVICHVNPSLEYLTVYDTEKADFTFDTYGIEFIWRDEDIKTLVYINPPAHFSEIKDPYQILNYNGDVLVESDKEISDLAFENSELTYKIKQANGSQSEEKIKLS